MDFQMLKVFCAVAKSGTFLSASKNLNYAQSHISTKMQQLESELNTTLFYRNNRGVSLTPKGEVFLNYAEKILSTAKNATVAMNENNEASGELKIGSLDSIAQMTLPKVLSTYHEKYPEVSLSLETGNSESLVAKVLERSLDLAFIAGGIWHADLATKLYCKDQMVLVSDKTLQNEDLKSLLAQKTLLLYQKGCFYRSTLEKLLQEQKFTTKNKMEFNSSGAILANISSGFGISYLPITLVNQSFQRDFLTLHQVPKPYDSIEIYLVYRKDRCLDYAFTEFLSSVQN